MNPMENQAHSSEKSPKGGWISSLIELVLSYYAELVSQPFRSGLAWFLGGLLPALFVGWILFPMALYSEQQQPVNFSHAIHSEEDIGIEGIRNLNGACIATVSGRTAVLPVSRSWQPAWNVMTTPTPPWGRTLRRKDS